MRKIFYVLIIVFTLTATQFAFAQPTNPALRTGPDGGVGSNDPSSNDFQLVTCSGVDDPRTTGTIEKECTYQDLLAMVQRIIQFVLYLLIPIVLGMIIYIGFKYLTAGGDSAKLADTKRMIKPLLLGIFFIFAAWLIVYTFLDKLLVEEGPVSGVPRSSIVPEGIK